MLAPWQVPGANEIDAGIVTTADAVQREGKTTQAVQDGVLVVRSDVGCAGGGETSSLCVREKGRQVVVVQRRWWGSCWQLKKTTREGTQLERGRAVGERPVDTLQET